MKRTAGFVVVLAGALTVFAALSRSIALNIGVSQRDVLTGVIGGYCVLALILLGARRGRRQGG